MAVLSWLIFYEIKDLQLLNQNFLLLLIVYLQTFLATFCLLKFINFLALITILNWT